MRPLTGVEYINVPLKGSSFSLHAQPALEYILLVPFKAQGIVSVQCSAVTSFLSTCAFIPPSQRLRSSSPSPPLLLSSSS